MSGESLLVILLVELIAGWLAGLLVRGFGFGLIGNIGIGVVGALIGSWLLPKLGIRIGSRYWRLDCCRHHRRVASSPCSWTCRQTKPVAVVSRRTPSRRTFRD